MAELLSSQLLLKGAQALGRRLSQTYASSLSHCPNSRVSMKLLHFEFLPCLCLWRHYLLGYQRVLSQLIHCEVYNSLCRAAL